MTRRLYKPIQTDPSSTVTLVITSCGRLDLLEKTLDSFSECNTYPVREVIIIEDSCNTHVYQAISERYKDIYTLVLNKEKLGQIRSIDRAYSFVSTPHIFHCEDDWLFTREGFIEESLAILESDKMVVQVWLRDVQETLHASSKEKYFYKNESFFWKILSVKSAPDSEKFWGGFSFNPGLRRKEDYLKIAPFSSVGHELEISMRYAELGYYAACLEVPAVEHIGDGYHVTDITVKKFPTLARLEGTLLNILTRLRMKLIVRVYFKTKGAFSVFKG